MTKVFITISLLIMANLALAADLPVAVVRKIIGQVTFDGKPIKVGDTLDKNGLLETQEKSLIQVNIAKWNNSISLGPSSKLSLNLAGEREYTLDKGVARWKTALKNKIKSDAKEKGIIYTNQISMGVRGTDFLIKNTNIFNESEVVMLDGEVMIGNLADHDNWLLIKKGQWGGIGGRFGKKIAPPFDLPRPALETYEKTIEAPLE